MTVNWTEFVEIVRDHQTFLLTSHIRPDCDAVGSELGLAIVLERLGKDVRIVNGHPTPPNLAFIDPRRRVQVLGEGVAAEDLEDVEVLIVLDTCAWAQLGPMSDVIRATKARKIVLDHHVIGDDIGATPFKDTTSEATGRLVADAAEALGVSLDAEIAAPLFAAIATDTGWFRFSSVSGETYRAAARLTDAGAVPSEIYRLLYECDSIGRIRLRGVILSRFTLELDGRLVHTFVRKADFDATGALPSDTEDAINMGLAVEGTQVAVILVEQPTGGFKISLRSRCELHCAELAAQFGGGGHKAAAGAFIDEPFEAAQKKLLTAVRAAMG